MFGNLDIQSIFTVLAGTAVFVLGTTGIRDYMRTKRAGNIFKGRVTDSKLVQKRDNENKLIGHYYELTVQYKGSTGFVNKLIKSVEEYVKGDEVDLILKDGTPAVYDNKKVGIIPLILMTLSGISLAVFPVVYRNVGEKQGSIALAMFFMLIGILFISMYMSNKGSNLLPIKGKIKELLCHKSESNSKILKPKNTYYPIIEYIHGEKEGLFLSAYNSSNEAIYKIGKSITIFYDEDRKCIVERKPNPFLLVFAVIFIGMACLGIVTLFV